MKNRLLVYLVFLVILINISLAEIDETTFEYIKDDPIALSEQIQADNYPAGEDQWNSIGSEKVGEIIQNYPADKNFDLNQIPENMRQDVLRQATDNPDLKIDKIPEGATWQNGKMIDKSGNTVDLNSLGSHAISEVNGNTVVGNAQLNKGTIQGTPDGGFEGDGDIDSDTATPTEPNIQVESSVKEGEGIKYDKDGNIESIEKLRSGTFDVTDANTGKTDTINIINGENIDFQNGFHVGSADSAEVNGANVVTFNDLTVQYGQKFEVKKADQVIIGDKIFTDIVDSSFEISQGVLEKAHVESAEDNNEWKMPPDIRSIGNMILIIAGKGTSMDYELTQEIYTGVSKRLGIKLRMDPGMKAKFMQQNMQEFMNFETYDAQGTIVVLENSHAYIKLKSGILNMMNNRYNESIESYGTSTLEMDILLGAGYVILAPISSPGGKYTYNDFQYPEASFSLYNPSHEPYEIGLKKTNDFFSKIKFNTIKNGTGYGYVDFIAKDTELNGEIEYGRYGDEKFTERLTRPIIRPLYTSYSVSNNAQIKLSLNNIDIKNFRVMNSDPTDKLRLSLYQGDHIITDSDKRYAKIDFENDVLNIIETYSNSWLPYNLTFRDGSLIQRGSRNTIVIFDVESKAQEEFEKSILLNPTFDEYIRDEVVNFEKWLTENLN